MIQQEVLLDFLRSLWLALKSASLYPRDHPVFKKSAEELKEKADFLLKSAPSLKISFTPRGITAEGKTWEKDKLIEELARFFHVRLVLNLEIKPNVSAEDWLNFISLLSRSSREVAREGGIRFLLEKRGISSFLIDELDYSQLLLSEGVEIQDVWAYLLSEAIREPDANKVRRAAEILPRFLAQVSSSELLADLNQNEDLTRFFSLLGEQDEEKFETCTTTLLRKIFEEKVSPKEGELTRWQEIITKLKDQTLASLLFDQLTRAEDFNVSSLEIFFSLINAQRGLGIARAFEEEVIHKIRELGEYKRFEERIRALLAGTPPLPASLSFFQEVLSTVLNRLSIRPRRALDPGHLSSSYRSMLLNILAGEADRQFISTFLEALLEEWPKIREEKDFPFLKLLFQAFDKRAEALAEEPSFRKLRSELADFVEKSLLSGESGPELEDMVKDLPRSCLGVNYYLINIFEKQKATPSVLRTFFHLFADDIFHFYVNLDQKKSDRRFLERLTESLAEVDSPHSLAVLKHIYSLGDGALKVKALRAMRHLSYPDENFLFRILRRANFAQKKEATLILKREPGTRKKLLQILFLRRSPFGLWNGALLEHLRIVEELDLQEAAEYVSNLKRRRFFWNKKLRREAGNLLRKWSFGQA